MQVNAHLNFNGQCEEAFKFYEKALGGKIASMMTYEGTPAADQMPADARKKIIHAHINIGTTGVMGADSPPGRYTKPQGITITLGTDTAAEAERAFSALSEKGEVGMPMAQTFFASRFGMVTDQFGIPWMVICQTRP